MHKIRRISVLSLAVLFYATAPFRSAASLHFANPVTYDSGGGGPTSVAVADVNGDGHADLVVANGCQIGSCNNGAVSVLLGNGDGTFQPAVSYSSGGQDAISVAIADVNGDGHPDIVVANGQKSGSDFTGTVGVLVNNGNGTFQPAVVYDTGGYFGFSMGILSGGGPPDIVVADLCQLTDNCLYRQYDTGAVSVLRNNGDGTFQDPAVYNSRGYLSTAVATVGRSWVVVNLCADYYCEGDGSVSVGGGSPFDSGGYDPEAVAFADVNGDGAADIVVANDPSISVFSAGAMHTYNNITSGGTVAVADVNGDGKADIVTLDGDRVTVLLGKGDGTFRPAVFYRSGGSSSRSVTLADVNGDGHADLLVANGGSNSVSVLLSTSAGAVTTTTVASSLNPSFIRQSVTVTATVMSVSGSVADGELVTFYDGNAVLGSSALTGGTATYTTTSLSVKAHNIKAQYSGDTNFKPSVGSIQQVVHKYSTTTLLTSSPNPSVYGRTVTFTATVTPSGLFSVTGKVRFWDGATSIGTSSLSGGVATLKKSRLAVGAHSITAQYLSDAYNDKSTSEVVNQVVQ